MKKLLPVILCSAVITTIVVMAVWFGMNPSTDESIGDTAVAKSGSAESAATDKSGISKRNKSSKGAKTSVDSAKLRQETRELQKRVDELEKQLAEKRRVNKANAKAPEFVPKCRYLDEDLKRLYTENPVEYTNLVNCFNARVDKELQEAQDAFLKKLEFLDSVRTDAASEEERAIHENYRTLLTLEHELNGFLKVEGNRLTIYRNKPNPPSHEEQVEESKPYNAAWYERIDVRKKMSVFDAQMRELLLGKAAQSLGLPAGQQSAAVETVRSIFEATGDIEP